MRRRGWAYVAGAVVLVVLCLPAIGRCIHRKILDDFTVVTMTTLATSPSGRLRLVEREVNNGAFGGSRSLRLTTDQGGDVMVAWSEWGFQYSATWEQEAVVEVTTKRLGAPDGISCWPGPHSIDGCQVTVAFLPSDDVRFNK